MKKILFLILLLLPLLVFGIYGYGTNLPESYEVTRRALYDQSVTAVWQAITDYEKMPGWSEHVEKVERLEDQEGLPVWRFYTSDGHYMDIEVVKAEEPNIYISRISETDMPFGGSWTFLLTQKGDEATEVILKEESYISSPLWRLLMKFVLGKGAMADAYLEQLGQKFGEKVEIR